MSWQWKESYIMKNSTSITFSRSPSFLVLTFSLHQLEKWHFLLFLIYLVQIALQCASTFTALCIIYRMEYNPYHHFSLLLLFHFPLLDQSDVHQTISHSNKKTFKSFISSLKTLDSVFLLLGCHKW